jgi:hypothetical protein
MAIWQTKEQEIKAAAEKAMQDDTIAKTKAAALEAYIADRKNSLDDKLSLEDSESEKKRQEQAQEDARKLADLRKGMEQLREESTRGYDLNTLSAFMGMLNFFKKMNEISLLENKAILESSIGYKMAMGSLSEATKMLRHVYNEGQIDTPLTGVVKLEDALKKLKIPEPVIDWALSTHKKVGEYLQDPVHLEALKESFVQDSGFSHKTDKDNVQYINIATPTPAMPNTQDEKDIHIYNKMRAIQGFMHEKYAMDGDVGFDKTTNEIQFYPKDNTLPLPNAKELQEKFVEYRLLAAMKSFDVPPPTKQNSFQP